VLIEKHSSNYNGNEIQISFVDHSQMKSDMMDANSNCSLYQQQQVGLDVVNNNHLFFNNKNNGNHACNNNQINYNNYSYDIQNTTNGVVQHCNDNNEQNHHNNKNNCNDNNHDNGNDGHFRHSNNNSNENNSYNTNSNDKNEDNDNIGDTNSNNDNHTNQGGHNLSENKKDHLINNEKLIHTDNGHQVNANSISHDLFSDFNKQNKKQNPEEAISNGESQKFSTNEIYHHHYGQSGSQRLYRRKDNQFLIENKSSHFNQQLPMSVKILD
jgi:hypothetical protein